MGWEDPESIEDFDETGERERIPGWLAGWLAG